MTINRRCGPSARTPISPSVASDPQPRAESRSPRACNHLEEAYWMSLLIGCKAFWEIQLRAISQAIMPHRYTAYRSHDKLRYANKGKKKITTCTKASGHGGQRCETMHLSEGEKWDGEAIMKGCISKRGWLWEMGCLEKDDKHYEGATDGCG